MNVAVKVYEPQCKVTLFKTIKRTSLVDGVPVSERFQGTGIRVDLSPYIGEGASVSTRKSVREPAGAFSLALLDRPFLGYVDVPLEQLPPGQTSVQSAESLYGIIEPMDVIEIRMRHGGEATSGDPPVVMRGFVSDVSRSQGMTQDGRPVRTVTIVGQDYGKLWQMLQIMYLPGYITGQDMLSAFKFFEKFGGGFKIAQPGFQFLRDDILGLLLNPYLEALMPADSPGVKTITMDEDQLRVHGTVSLSGPQNFEGVLYSMLTTYLDVGTWNELFLEDRDDGVYLVYRPNPFKDAKGEMIDPDAAKPDMVGITDADVVSLNVSRSDRNVANYYWVRSPRFEVSKEIYREQETVTEGNKKTVVLGDYQNASDKLYGIRAMKVDTQMGGDEIENFGSGLKEGQVIKDRTDQVNWIDTRRKQLVEMNKDNVLFESGTIHCRGNEKLRHGIYLQLIQGQFAAEYYIVECSHDYVWGQSYTNTLRVERGTGFIERAKRGGGKDSPYFSEMAR